jgi:hypothetical protein
MSTQETSAYGILILVLLLAINAYVGYFAQNALSYGCSADCSAVAPAMNPRSNNLFRGRKVVRVLVVVGLVVNVVLIALILLSAAK